MATISPTAPRSGLRRALRPAAALFVGLLVTTCADNPTAPNRPGFGALRVQPAFDQYAQYAPLLLNQVRAIVVRPPSDTLIDTLRAFNPSDNQLRLSLNLTLQASRETMDVTLHLLAGQTLLFSGTEAVEVRQGGTPPATSIPVTYEGPGANADSLEISPRDTIVRVGTTAQMSATAFDGEGDDVGQFYLSWSLVGSAPGASIDASGLLHAPTSAGTFYVRGITPGGLRDSVEVRAVPPPSTLVKSAGDNQTGAPGEALEVPLAVLVTGTGGIAVPGVQVSWEATTGGGTLDSSTTTTDAQGIARTTVVLGQAVGAQSFTASAAGLTPVVFTATAQGVTIDPAPRLITSGLEHTCELRGGAAFCWGGNGAGQLGDNNGEFNIGVAVPVQGGRTFTTLTAGEMHTCGLTSTGQAYCWGDNELGQLGDGTTTTRGLPTLVSGGRTFVQIEAGGYHTCALTVSGEAFCWGSNDGGQIGDGTSANNRLVPTAVIGGLTFARLAGGEDFNCALNPAGAAYCWGQNGSGQLGDGSTTGRTNPVAVGGGLVFEDIGAGYETSCALTTTGAGYCWGNFFNQTLTEPQAIGGGPFTSFSTGGTHVCAVTAAGAAFCGGDNSNGQLGDGNAPNDSPTPVPVAGGLSFTELAAGSLHTCGRASDGTYCWGRGNAGQAGDGGYLQRNTPVQVRGPATSIAVNDGNNQSALPGTPLSTAPSVIVRDQQGQPLRGVRVAFAVTAGGGSLTVPNPFTDDNGVARVGSWTLGSTPGANTLGATATYPGLGGNPVSFTATGGAPPVFRTWTGAVSSDWSDAGNWNGGVPSGSDSAVIVAATNPPRLNAETTVGAVHIAGGQLILTGHGLSVARTLATSGTGVLVMSSSADQVTVGGNAIFGGGDQTGLLSGGELTIGGNFTQLATTSPFSFAASGSHITLFTAGAHTISFATPASPSGSGFNDVEFFGGGTVTLASPTWVGGTLDVNAAGQLFSSSNGSHLRTNRLVATAPVTFNNVPLVIDQALPGAITNQPLTFQNMATNVVQLEINHPGSASELTLTGFVFSTTPVAPNGFYLDVRDNAADGNPLVINMVNPTPGTGAPFVRTTGEGAAVNWAPSAGTLRTWNGSVSSDWDDAGNWDGGVVPVTGDDVLIPEDAVNDPVFSSAITLRNLTLESESGETVLTLDGDGSISLTGDLLAHGQVTGSATIALIGTGPHQVTAELLSNLNVEGNTTVTGQLTIERSLQISSGIFDLRDRQVQVGQAFRTLNSGTIQMNSGSFLSIDGNAVFSGASTAGLIEGGGINVGGDFTAAAADGSFAPGNGNSVNLTGSGDQTITLGSTASYFDSFGISKSDGSVVLGSDITVFQTFGGSGTIVGPHTITAGDLNANGMTFDGVRLVYNALTAVAPFGFDNITFDNYSAAPPQFAINHPGLAVPIAFDGITFSGTPVTFHLQVNDNNVADGVGLTVNLTNATPADGTGLFQVLNGATVGWPPESTAWAWTGASGTNWSVAGNWDRNSIPPTNADVTIGAAVNQPTLTADVTVNSVVVSTAGARLTLGGHTLTLTGGFITHTDGVLISTDPADRLIVQGSVTFQGGDETGLITAGELRVAGDFSQQVQTSPFSFLASGSHRTILNNPNQLQSVRFCCGANTSKFMNLDISQSAGINIQFAISGVFVADTFIVQPGTGPAPRLYMLGSPFQARRLKVNKLIVDRGTLTLNEAGVAGNQEFDNVTFENYQTTQTQLALTLAGGAPRSVTFSNLRFNQLSTGNTGRYLVANTSGGSLVVNLPGATPASNGPAFTAAGGGVTVNWPADDNVTWTGAVSTDWFAPGNWSTGLVPISSNDVIIPAGTPNAPSFGANGNTITSLTVNSGATLTIPAGGQLMLQGNLAVDGIITGAGIVEMYPFASSAEVKSARGTLPSLNAFVSIDLTGTLRVTDSLMIGGASSRLALNGHPVVVGGNLITVNGGRLSMTNAADSLDVGGNVTFDGFQDDGLLIAGVIRARGSFTQTLNGSFVSGGTHRVVMAGTSAQNIQFADPTVNHFYDLTIANTSAPVNILSPVQVWGMLRATSPLNELRNGDSVLALGGTDITGLTLTGTLLRIVTTMGAPITFNNVTFTGQAPSATQLAIDHPGLGVGESLSLSGLTFNAVPSTGRYLRVTDNAPGDGNTLTVNLLGPTPGTPGAFTEVIGGAVINWPAIPGASTWTGTASAAWADPANWSAGVPGSTTAVTIPAGTPNIPIAGAVSGSSAGNLTVAPGATLTLAPPFNLTVHGNIDAQGTIGPNSQALTLAGTAQTLRGNVPQLSATSIVTLSGNTTATSTGPCVFNGTAELIVNGFTFTCFQLQFNDNARLQMTNPADSLVVLGPATFAGGSTVGRLTAGALDLRGSFQQLGGNSITSFASTGTRVRLGGSGTSSISIENGGSTASRFASILVNKGGGTLTLLGPVVALDSVSVTSVTSISGTELTSPRLRVPVGVAVQLTELRVNGTNLSIGTPASYTVPTTILDGIGPVQVIPDLPYQTLHLRGAASHTFAMPRLRTNDGTAAGALFIHGGDLEPEGKWIQTAARLVIDSTGGLIMRNPSDSVIVGGNAFFQSRFDQSGKLTAGVLRIGQNMTVRRDPDASPRAFVAEGTHKTVFNNPTVSTVDVENPTATDSRFQNVEVLGGGNLQFVSGAHISGNLDVTGTASINSNLTLNVRGLLTTSGGSGMGVDTLVLGDPVAVAPGSGFINARVWVLDATGPQTMPAIPAPAGADTASLIIRSETGFTSDVTLNGLRIESDGLLEVNEQTINVFGDFATAGNGRLFMQYPLSRLTVTGATTFGGGNTFGALTAGILTTSGRFTQVGTNSPTSFRAIGDHITRIATNYPGGNIVSFATPAVSGFQNLELSVPVTWASDIEVYNNFTNTTSTPMSAGRFAVRGTLTQSGNSIFTPRKLVFHGPAMSVTNGTLAPDTVEFRQNPISFVLPVGEPRYFWNHMLMRENANVRLGAASPALASLDMSEGSVLELNNIGLAVGGTFTATPGTVVDGGGGGGVVVAQRFQVNGLTVGNGRLELIEGGIPETQQLDNVTFQGLTSLGSNALLTVTGAGNNVTPRSLTFNAVNFPVISDGLYARLTSSNAENFNLVLAGSNRVAEGPAASNPENETRVNGALIDWQP